MTKRKIAVLLAFVVLFLFSAVCSAGTLLPKEQIAIGGITIGMSLSEVKAILGNPVAERNGTLFYGQDRNNTNLAVSFDSNGKVFAVSSSDYKLATTAGVTIGTPYSEVVRLLGEPYYIQKGTMGYYGEGDSGSLHIDMTNYYIDGNGMPRYENTKVRTIHMNTNRPRTQPTQQQPVKKNTQPARVTQIDKAELNIGGINRGQSMEYVEQVYGKPIVFDDQGLYQVYNYNDLFIVRGRLNHGYKVDAIVIYDKNLGTPSGFKVGMSFDEVIKKYGQGQTVKYKFEGLEKKFKGCRVYIYFCGEEQMVFIVDKNQIIRAIKIEPLDEELFREYKK